ncbi:MAG: metallophosphoesterase [Deltaproteobacteria bacterium]|nr:metallophosphoesterase [Deltaproteobacteria bacterium]
MWFVFLGVGLVLLVVIGLYVRRRLADSLTHLGVGARAVRWTRRLVVWLLFGYPLLMIAAVVVSLVSGRATLVRLDDPLPTWLLVYPFYLALLVALQSVPYLLVLELVHWVLRRQRGRASADKLRAIAVLVVMVGFGLYTPLRILAERDTLNVRHHRVATSALPAPLRIAFVADVQQDAHTDTERANQVVAQVNASTPDVVLSGGDWINTGPDYIEAAAVTAGALKSRLGTFTVRGDHEHFGYVDQQRSAAEVERALAAHGVITVNDEVRWFEHHGARIGVLFLDYNYIHRTDDATIAARVAALAGADYAIVVAHQFDARLAALVKDKVDLVLAAHTHGGQVNPVIGVMHVPLARIETPYIDGRYALGTTTVIVTSGVGFSLVPFRYAAPASIEIVELGAR